MYFNQVYIVKKLDAKNDPIVQKMCSLIQLALVKRAHKQMVEENQVNQHTLVIAVGGDGTMLEAMRIAQLKDAVATGINVGKVGFLTDFANDDKLADEISNEIHELEHFIEERIVLKYHLLDKGESNLFNPRLAFNEFVISNKLSDHLIKYTLFIGNQCAGTHRANALIVGTPTGSTAYSLSAGGGLLLPSMEAMQIIPVASISMTSRPIIVPSHEEVRVSIETHDQWILKSDGVTIGTFDNNSFIDTQIVITQSSQKVKILHNKYWSFFDMLTQKLGWKSN